MPIKSFNTVLVYRLTTDEHPFAHADEIDDILSAHQARYPASQELATLGFVPAFGEADHYAEEVRPGVYQVALLKHERMLPGNVVRDALARKVALIEEEQLRKVYSREKAQLKDEIIQAYLPRAFVKTTRMNALIAPPYVYIDQSSPKKAEAVLSLLREALGSFPVRPLTVKVTPSVTLTDWVLHGIDNPRFDEGESFQATSESSESSTLSGKNVDLSDPDLLEVLRCGHRITQLGLVHLDRASGESVPFTVTESLGLKGIIWPEYINDGVRQEIGDDESAVTFQRAVAFVLYPALRDLVADLLDALGGEEATDQPAAAAEADDEELL